VPIQPTQAGVIRCRRLGFERGKLTLIELDSHRKDSPMVWQNILRTLSGSTKRSSQTRKRTSTGRVLRLEQVEKRQLMASDLASITGRVYVDLEADNLPTGNPSVAISGANLVAPGTAGATGVNIRLYRDNGATAGVFDGTDQVVGNVVSNPTTGVYRFDGLTVGNYFVQQSAINGVTVPSQAAPVLVNVNKADGVQTVQIDDFEVNAPALNAANATPLTAFHTGLTGVVGTERDVRLTNTNSTGQASLIISSVQGTISVGNVAGSAANALLQYDGVDGSINLNSNGLGGISLGGGLATDPVAQNGGLLLNYQADQVGATVRLTIHSGANNVSTMPLTLIAFDPLTPLVTTRELFVPFSAFTVGAGVNFNSIGAIEAEVIVPAGTPNNDIDVSIIEARRPDVFTRDLPNVQPLTLSGTIFTDVSQAAGNDGTRQGNEPAFTTAVEVQLFRITDPNAAFDPAATAPTATITTTNGNYSFADLTPGDYRVVIPASQFVDNPTGPDGPLFGHASSLFAVAAVDPDNNTDNDDNGAPIASGAIVSLPITLVSQSETDGTTANTNTNSTLDFGVIPQVDLQVTKTLNVATSTVVPGGRAIFDISVQNLGPLSATNVVVTDTLPSGLTFNAAQSDSAFSVAGNVITANIAALNVGVNNARVLTLVADIAANQTTDLVNPATVRTFSQIETNQVNNSSSAPVDLKSTDLRITKTASPDPVAAGGNLTYTLLVENLGPDDAAGVFVTDLLPNEVTFVSGTATIPGLPGTNANLIVQSPTNPRDLRINVGALANAARATITLTVRVDQNSPNLFTNSARVNVSPDTDSNTDNDTSSANANVRRDVDLDIEKTFTVVGGTNPVAGGRLRYTVEVTNNGPGLARGVTVNDLLPANVTYGGNLSAEGGKVVTIQQSDDTTETPDDADNQDNLTFTLPNIGTAATDAVRFSFDVILGQNIGSSVENVATVATTDNDTIPANNRDPVTANIDRTFDLTIDKSVDLATATPGSATPLVYTIVVTNSNASAADAPNVRVTDTLPAGLTPVSGTAPGAVNSTITFTNGAFTVDYLNLAKGQSQTITINATVLPTATGTIRNIANVASTTAAASESNTNNNSNDAETTLVPQFDVAVTKAVTGGPSFGPGATVTYTVGLQNNGPSRATGIVLSDVVPAGLTFVTGTLNGQTVTTAPGGTVTFNAVDINPGTTNALTATLQFTVNPTASGTIRNTASIPDNIANELVKPNNTAGVDITVAPRAELFLTKTVNRTEAQAGSQLTYTITVTNEGPSPAQAVMLTDTLPAGVTFVSGTGPNGAILNDSNNDRIVTHDAGILNNGSTFTYTIIAQLSNTATGVQTNQASVTTTTTEAGTRTNTASAATTVDPVTSTISGRVYIDSNNSGTQDTGEVGIGSVALALSGTDSLGNALTRSTTSAANGDYSFANLPAGTYTVTQSQPSGLRDGRETVGTGATGATAADNVFRQIGLGADADGINFNFGELTETLSKRRFLNTTT
jgi:uncharacterized repeat protein (TIGR01451 family)